MSSLSKLSLEGHVSQKDQPEHIGIEPRTSKKMVVEKITVMQNTIVGNAKLIKQYR
jgi:hypothetical protein